MYDFDDEFREPRLADILEVSVHNALMARRASGKNMCMDVDDFLRQARAAALKLNTEGTLIAEFDELNDMIMIHVADENGTETYAVAVPRNPSTDTEELLLASVADSATLKALEGALRLKPEHKEKDSDESDAHDGGFQPPADMTVSNLKQIARDSAAMLQTLHENMELMGWAEDKVSQAKAFIADVRNYIETDFSNGDLSDEEIERVASKLDKLASQANNVQETYMIELAVAQLRELKGE